MKKDIYDFSNETDIDLDEYEKVELNDIEKQKIKNSIKTKKRGFIWKKALGGVLVASLALFIFGQTKTGGDVFAAAKKYIFEQYNIVFQSDSNRKDDLSDLVEQTGIVKEFDDYNIELRYSVRNGNRGFFRLLLEYKKDIDYENARLAPLNNERENFDDEGNPVTVDEDFDYGLFIDGKKYLAGGSRGDELIDKENKIFQMDINMNFENGFEEKIKSNSKIEFKIQGLSFEFDGVQMPLQKEVVFDISNNFKDMSYLNRKFEIVGDKKFTDEKTGIDFEVENIRINQLNQLIEIDYKNDKENLLSGDSRLYILGVTNEGKQFQIPGHTDIRNKTKGLIELEFYDNSDNTENIYQNRSISELFNEMSEDEFYKDILEVNLNYLGDEFTGEASIKDMLNAKELKIIVLFEEWGIEITENENGEKIYSSTGMQKIRNTGEFTIKFK